MKEILKQIKLREDTISMVIGALVVIVVGIIVVNFFRSRDTGDTLPTGVTTEEQATTHTVARGETLWDIAITHYNDGFRWVDIRDANALADANDIEVGMELIIPDIERAEDRFMAGATPQEEDPAKPEEPPAPSPETETADAPQDEVEIAGDVYTVVRGDNLWTIAERTYGNGFRWVDIAKANDLANPSIIHAGNQLQLPR